MDEFLRLGALLHREGRARLRRLSALALPGVDWRDLAPRLVRGLRERSPALAASAGIHALLLIVIVLAWPEPVLPPPAPRESMAVDLVTGEQFTALTRPRPAPKPSPSPVVLPLPPAAPAAPAAPPPLPPLSHARRILSGGALDRVATASLHTLREDARLEQLCDVEAMEQIVNARQRFKPEKAVAYATAETRVEDGTLIAPGAAFLSEGHWYHLAFKCRATPDGLKVLSFDFAIGEQFTKDDPNLPTDPDDD